MKDIKCWVVIGGIDENDYPDMVAMPVNTEQYALMGNRTPDFETEAEANQQIRSIVRQHMGRLSGKVECLQSYLELDGWLK